MDLAEAMNLWQQMGHSIVSWNTKEGYYCLFVAYGQVKGHTKAVAGGIHWDYPQILIDTYKQDVACK